MKSLQVRAISGLVFLIFILGLIIFVSAGTMNYSAGLMYFGVFSISIIIITLYFLKKNPSLVDSRTKVGPTAEKEINQKIIQSFASLFFIALLIVPGLDHRFGWSHVPFTLVVFSNLIALLGFTGIFWVMSQNSFASSTIEIADDQKVISTGAYALIRHPMYSFALLLLVFTPMALGSYWGLLFSAGIVVVIILRLLDEEKYLLKNLPGYEEYYRKIKYRLIPGIW